MKKKNQQKRLNYILNRAFLSLDATSFHIYKLIKSDYNGICCSPKALPTEIIKKGEKEGKKQHTKIQQ